MDRSSGTKEDIEEVQKAKVKFRSSKAAGVKDEHAQFSGSITAAYDRYLGTIVPAVRRGSDGTLAVEIAEAMLIALFLMHIKGSSLLLHLAAVAGVVWLPILISLTLADYIIRG